MTYPPTLPADWQTPDLRDFDHALEYVRLWENHLTDSEPNRLAAMHTLWNSTAWKTWAKATIAKQPKKSGTPPDPESQVAFHSWLNAQNVKINRQRVNQYVIACRAKDIIPGVQNAAQGQPLWRVAVNHGPEKAQEVWNEVVENANREGVATPTKSAINEIIREKKLGPQPKTDAQKIADAKKAATDALIKLIALDRAAAAQILFDYRFDLAAKNTKDAAA